jgi:hypothetical protein
MKYSYVEKNYQMVSIQKLKTLKIRSIHRAVFTDTIGNYPLIIIYAVDRSKFILTNYPQDDIVLMQLVGGKTKRIKK